jgi:hypothetical protein
MSTTRSLDHPWVHLAVLSKLKNTHDGGQVLHDAGVPCMAGKLKGRGPQPSWDAKVMSIHPVVNAVIHDGEQL